MSDETMRAMLLHEWGGRLRPGRVPVPTPGPGEALVKVEVASVGLTVVNNIRGTLGADTSLLPMIPGHELAGVVAEVGVGVTNVRPGDRVVNYVYWNCGYCRFCLRKKEPLCLNLRGFPGVNLPGVYAEYHLSPAANLASLPDEIPLLDASAIPDAITTSYHVINSRGRVRPGDVVAIIGAAGGVGIHLCQMAKLFGGEVVAVDIDDAKLERTLDFGASAMVNLAKEGADEGLQQATGGYGCDVVVDMVGRPETAAFAQRSLARGGRAVFLTTFPTEATFQPRHLVSHEAELIGSRYAAKHELLAAIELVRQGRIKPVVSDVVDLEEVETLFDRLRDAAFFGRGAITLETTRE
jgi:propanol-preferring alcohol dehydrogenase